MLGAVALAHATDPKATVAAFDAGLDKMGASKIDGTDTVASMTVPAILFGSHKINDTYNVVYPVRK